jgi:methionine-gamma-lyase
MAKEENYSILTRLIYGESHTEEWDFGHHVIPPLTSSTTFRLKSVERGSQGFTQIGSSPDDLQADPIYVYNRMGDPVIDMLQSALAVAEKGECAVTFSTGMAAVHAATGIFLEHGSEIICHQIVYGCTYSLFTTWMAKLGVKVHFADLSKPRSFLPLINEKTRIIYIETPANPTLEMTDISAVTSIIKEQNQSRPADKQIYSVIDNTFSTPYTQRPIEHGVDLVVHSLTKGISGFGTDMGGAVITRNEFFHNLILHRKDFGASLSPKAAWHILVYGIPTLGLRIERQQTNALRIATLLENHPAVEAVFYPGLESYPQRELALKQLRNYRGEFSPGFMIYFTLKGENPEDSKTKGAKLMNYIADNSYAITLAVSLGQLRTLIEHPASMTHSAYSAEEQASRGMHPGGIRLAVGIEEAEDIMKDLETALQFIS